jgi:hypothetical protein
MGIVVDGRLLLSCTTEGRLMGTWALSRGCSTSGALFGGSTEPWVEVGDTPVVFGPEDLPKLRKAGHSPKEAVFPFRPNMTTVRIGAGG